MIEESGWEEIKHDDDDGDSSSAPSVDTDTPDEKENLRIEIIRLFEEEEAIIRVVRTYPHYPEGERGEILPNGAELIHAPGYRDAMTINTPELGGFQGFKPLSHTPGTTIELSKLYNLSYTSFRPKRFGVNSQMSLTLGLYGDRDTAEDMEAFVRNNPTWGRVRLLHTSFFLDKEGNGIVQYNMPDTFPRPTKNIRSITTNKMHGLNTVVRDIDAGDLEIARFAISKLKEHLPEEMKNAGKETS